MPTVKLRFPGGRYHATPWGHHVNEGLIEWPPSPWRLLRALIASGYNKLGWRDVPPVAHDLMNKLATVLPLYRLPPASTAHSRHYMPYVEGKAQKTTLVFDTWANVGDGQLLIHWPCELNSDELSLLGELTRALDYLGRSESWIEAEVSVTDGPEWNSVPCLEGEHRGPGWEQVSLMAAIPPEDYTSWRNAQVERALAPFPLPEGKKKPPASLVKNREKATEPYPIDLWSCLTKDTTWWKGQGWSQPPGSQRVLYWRPANALEVGVPVSPRRGRGASVECMLLSIMTPSGNLSALPPVTRTLPQAELLHRAIVCRAAGGQRVNCPSLTGKDDSGKPLRQRHEHAHTLPLDLDNDGRLDHILIYARMGLCPTAQRAIRSLKRTWTKGGIGDLQLAVVGCGSLQSLRRLPPRLREQIEQILGPREGARVWETLTPFVPPRHLKKKGKNTLLGQLNAELESRRLPRVASIDECRSIELTKSLRHHVRRRRRGGLEPPRDIGYGLRIVLAEPACGPISLGYGSHYGLGQLRAVPGGAE